MALLTLSLVLGVLFVYSSAECNLGNRGKRVLDGDPIDIKEAPFMASLLNIHEGFLCGGTLIDKQWIVTAAHCFDKFKLRVKTKRKIKKRGKSSKKKPSKKGKPQAPLTVPHIKKKKAPEKIKYKIVRGDDASTWKVALGTTKQIKYKDGLAVSHIILHESYNEDDPNTRNDIALVRLTAAAKLNQNTGLAEMIKKGENPTKDCAIYGWGWSTAKSGISEILLSAKAERLDEKQCKKLDKDYEPTTDICTKPGPHCGYDGDSGGPLMCTIKSKSKTPVQRLVGVYSLGDVGKAKLDIFSKVFHFLPWIEQKMNAKY